MTADTFDREAFRHWLNGRGFATSAQVARYAVRCMNDGITTPDEVDERLPDLSLNHRRLLRNSLRWVEVWQAEASA